MRSVSPASASNKPSSMQEVSVENDDDSESAYRVPVSLNVARSLRYTVTWSVTWIQLLP
jgi:hypothetical protein